MLQWDFIFKKKNKPKEESIRFHERAIQRFEKEQQKNPKVLSLTIQIKKNKDKFPDILVGFSEEIGDEKYTIPLQLAVKDEERLIGGELDFGENEKQFMFYPDIVLDWENTPKPNIFKINANKPIAKPGIIFMAEKGQPAPVVLWNEILRYPEVKSLYVFDSFFQLELSRWTQEIEEELTDIILQGLLLLPPPWEG